MFFQLAVLKDLTLHAKQGSRCARADIGCFMPESCFRQATAPKHACCNKRAQNWHEHSFIRCYGVVGMSKHDAETDDNNDGADDDDDDDDDGGHNDDNDVDADANVLHAHPTTSHIPECSRETHRDGPC